MGAPPPTAQATAPPGFAEQLLALIPVNPIAAAAETAMAPLIVFAALFGAAAARLPEADRTPLLAAIKGGGDALLVIVGWALKAAPAGVFLLALDAAAGMVQYVLMLSGVLAVGLVCALAMGMASAGPVRFLKAVSGPAALAASTQSSMASLPALITAARDELGLPPAFVGSLMPLAVTVFRFGNVFGAVGAGLIGAHLFGVQPSAAQIGLAILICVLTNIGVMGLPGAAVLLAGYGPVFNALGAPIEALTLLIAVFTLPDILDTSCNVTADLAVVSVVGRLSGEADDARAEVIAA
jgi:Na+/H+-dicarboxylate symporter